MKRNLISMPGSCAVACLLAAWVLIWTQGVVYPHEAHTVQGYPLGWMYDPGCCRSAAEPGGDCAPIQDKYVEEKPDGYHVNLPVGAHPQLVTKGYSGVVPYNVVKRSPEGNFHICLSRDGGHRFCFYAGPRGF